MKSSVQMSVSRRVKHIYVGRYVAEVDVEMIEDATGWAPYLSVSDTCKLDDVRSALHRGDLKAASLISRVYELCPVTVQ